MNPLLKRISVDPNVCFGHRDTGSDLNIAIFVGYDPIPGLLKPGSVA